MVAEQRGGSAASLVDALVPLIMEEIVEVINAIPRERIAKRICEQIVDVHVSQATEVPKTSSRDRTLQRAVEQILDVPVPEMVTQLLEVPKIIHQDRILQRTVKQGKATQVLQSETSGADGQTYSSFQENSSAVLQTSTDLKGFELVMIGQTARRAGTLNRA